MRRHSLREALRISGAVPVVVELGEARRVIRSSLWIEE